MVPAAVALRVMDPPAACPTVTRGILAPATPRAASVSTSMAAKNLPTAARRRAWAGSAARQAFQASRSRPTKEKRFIGLPFY